MSYKPMLAYAWDLAESGTTETVTACAGLGLDTISLAGSHNAGNG